MYIYKEQRRTIFTEEGVEKLLETRAAVTHFLQYTTVFTMGDIFGRVMGDTWGTMACVDYLVERGVIREVQQRSFEVAGQHRIFRSA